ncbi:F-box only protein 48 [Xenopus laevis]|uniref:F-box only protein 48 n=2 Tax=Xenopus laevis TaxID=8355 RepID=A0A1L8G700_XENLA|nr:F-box only protein 48 [Xenopus laevis]OCT79668.1 hypothetical protein XELAEV_18026476mg [Xenopus laevis]
MAEQKSTLDIFPLEIIYKIFAYLDVKHLCIASSVCKDWNEKIKENDILWKKYCLALPDEFKENIQKYCDSGYTWKETLQRTNMEKRKARVQHNWLHGAFSNIRSFEELPADSMFPLDAEAWGEILEAEERRN